MAMSNTDQQSKVKFAYSISAAVTDIPLSNAPLATQMSTIVGEIRQFLRNIPTKL